MSFSFYSAQQVYQEKYIQLPTIFFTSEKYSDLSNDAKVAYALLKDRFSYSLRNNWIDDDGNIYFIYTVDELKKILNCADGKVAKIKKELEKKGLLYQKRNGMQVVNGVKKNVPNWLYLGRPEVTAEDVFSLQTDMNNDFSRSGFSKIANPQKSQSDSFFYGNAKIENPQDTSDTKGSSGFAKIANNLLDSLSLDTLDTLETPKGKPTSYVDDIEVKNIIDSEFVKSHSDSFFDEQSLRRIMLIAEGDINDAERLLKTANSSKKVIERLSGVSLILDRGAEDSDEYVLGKSAIDQVMNDSVNQFFYQLKKGDIRNKFAYASSVFKTAFLILAMYQLTLPPEFDYEKHKELAEIAEQLNIDFGYIEKGAKYLSENL